MKIYDNKEEAMEAAEALNEHLDCVCTVGATVCPNDGNSIDVCIGKTVLKRFPYKPERVAPAMGQAVIGFTSELGTEVLAVLNGLRNTHGKACAGMKLDGDACSSTALASYTPVDIIPAGQFAKAVELLGKYVDHLDGFATGVTAGHITKLLDEIKAGGE